MEILGTTYLELLEDANEVIGRIRGLFDALGTTAIE